MLIFIINNCQIRLYTIKSNRRSPSVSHRQNPHSGGEESVDSLREGKMEESELKCEQQSL